MQIGNVSGGTLACRAGGAPERRGSFSCASRMSESRNDADSGWMHRDFDIRRASMAGQASLGIVIDIGIGIGTDIGYWYCPGLVQARHGAPHFRWGWRACPSGFLSFCPIPSILAISFHFLPFASIYFPPLASACAQASGHCKTNLLQYRGDARPRGVAPACTSSGQEKCVPCTPENSALANPGFNFNGACRSCWLPRSR